MSAESDGRASYKKLEAVWHERTSVYGPEFARALYAFILEKAAMPVDERVKWVYEKLQLPNAKKGLLNYDGSQMNFVIQLLTGSYKYGFEAYIPLLKSLLQELEQNGVTVPPEVNMDIDNVVAWVKSAYGIDM